ncbi:Hsp20/alpha crystallin family protein [Falsiroseomonas oryzae]|uniref:Hsp20/alpha crystallin family protein n=1 Tax=Falsiroseomonas oryzae TaxID=2766473 RepID=UPI0022EB742A|nr:Hsp20/alpha crystallin family protein [Roseomonas sp. MO-31]
MSGTTPTNPGQAPMARPDTDPFTSLRRGMDRLFDQVLGGSSWGAPWGNLPAAFTATGVLSPKVDVAETPAGLEVTAELPGIEAKDVSIELHEGVLTLRAERSAERKEEDKDKRWHIVERQSGTYLRRFALPFDADPDKVEARFDKGVLHIVIPRPAEQKPQARRIEIKG